VACQQVLGPKGSYLSQFHSSGSPHRWRSPHPLVPFAQRVVLSHSSTVLAALTGGAFPTRWSHSPKGWFSPTVLTALSSGAGPIRLSSSVTDPHSLPHYSVRLTSLVPSRIIQTLNLVHSLALAVGWKGPSVPRRIRALQPSLCTSRQHGDKITYCDASFPRSKTTRAQI
jgi:hypothetical protein